MGYRSQVVSAVVFADEAHNTRAMVAWKLHCAAENKLDVVHKDENSSGMAEHITFPKLGGRWPSVVLSNLNVGDWKWYDSYPDVQGWHHFIEWMREQHDAATVFLRIGEETQDIVEEFEESSRDDMSDFYPWDFFSVHRSIAVSE